MLLLHSESLELKFTFEVKDIEKKKLYNIFYEVNLTKQEEETDYYALKDLLIRNFCILNSH